MNERNPIDGNNAYHSTITEEGYPAWYDGKKINEVLFCEEFLREHPMRCIHDVFFTTEGRVTDEAMLQKDIFERIKPYVTSSVAKRAANLLDALRVECWSPPLPVYQDRIHVANGTIFLNGTFTKEKDFCVNRLPVRYSPDAPPPVTWLSFLNDLLVPEDILGTSKNCELTDKFIDQRKKRKHLRPREQNGLNASDILAYFPVGKRIYAACTASLCRIS